MSKSTTVKKKRLGNEIARLLAERSKLEAEERANANRKIVGKCFRYANRYSDGESWWLYSKVISLDEYGWLTVFRFEETIRGRFEASTETLMDMDRHDRITEGAFWDAFDDFKNRLNAASHS